MCWQDGGAGQRTAFRTRAGQPVGGGHLHGGVGGGVYALRRQLRGAAPRLLSFEGPFQILVEFHRSFAKRMYICLMAYRKAMYSTINPSYRVLLPLTKSLSYTAPHEMKRR